MSIFMENSKSHSSANSCIHLCICPSTLSLRGPDAITPPHLQGAPSSSGPSALCSRLINHGAWVMTPCCSPNVFWQEAVPWAPSSRSHTYGRCEWVTGPLLRTTEAISGAYTDTSTRTHTPAARDGEGGGSEVLLGWFFFIFVSLFHSLFLQVRCQEQYKESKEKSAVFQKWFRA